MNANFETLIRYLTAANAPGAPTRESPAAVTEWLVDADDRQVEQLLGAALLVDPPEPEPSAEQPWQAVLVRLAHRHRMALDEGRISGCSAEASEKIAALYTHLGPFSGVRHHLLAMLTASKTARDLARFADLLAADPPASITGATVPLVELFRRRDFDPGALFPRLLDGLAHATAAAGIVDLSNYVLREGMVEVHPAADRSAALIGLLGGLIERLGRLEEHPEEAGPSPGELRRKVFESVTLAVSLCDALALIGDENAVGKLYQASELGHRRLRVEAAAALVRLGETEGEVLLATLAAEPIVRRRVLHYAEELHLADRIEEQYRTDAALAEADLVAWLADPTRIGIPPGECKLIDERTQFWPGAERPVRCYLFRYTYSLPQGSYSNVGIAGPLTCHFTADLTDMPAEDVYAVFAGWQAEHDDIYEIDVREMTAQAHVDVDRLERRLLDARFERIEPVKLGVFFGEMVLVARANRHGIPGTALADSVDEYWIPAGNAQRPIGPEEAYSIYKGRKLLRTFNDPEE